MAIPTWSRRISACDYAIPGPQPTTGGAWVSAIRPCSRTSRFTEQVGDYNLKYRLAADYDFLLRALEEKVEFVAVDALVNYRNTGLSASNLARLLGEIDASTGSISASSVPGTSSSSFCAINQKPAADRAAACDRQGCGEGPLNWLKALYTKIFLCPRPGV